MHQSARGTPWIQRHPNRSMQKIADDADGQRRSLRRDLADAVRHRALGVHYQPQYDLITGRMRGVEALTRWELSNGETIPPSCFIPVAEKIGLIHELGKMTLSSACKAAMRWCSNENDSFLLSVNVSPLQIDEGFGTHLKRVLIESAFPAGQLELEITETALAGNPERIVEQLLDWRRLGVRIVLDDFGSGYSSLSRVALLPIDGLKIDLSLVRVLTSGPRALAVIRSVVAMGRELGIDVIAEGVETSQELRLLLELGCSLIQGYLVNGPMSADAIELALAKPVRTHQVLGEQSGPARKNAHAA